MKRFRVITAICLIAVSVMVIGNAYYLYGLYGSIKDRTMQTVSECARRADISEIITRLNEASSGSDMSSLTMQLKFFGEENGDGKYAYPHILGQISSTMSTSFHLIEKSDTTFPPRDYPTLDSLLAKELNNAGLYPQKVWCTPFDKRHAADTGIWTLDFSIAGNEPPVYTVNFSALNGHILRQMAGIIATSAGILAVMSFLIWYLLHFIGRLRTIEEMKDDFTHNMTHELKTPVAVAYSAADSILRYYDPADEARTKRFVGIIMQHLTHLSGLIDNILSMSMERFKKISLLQEHVELKPLLTRCGEMIALKADKEVKLDIDVEPADLTVTADALHLGNIITNLLDNAVKYSGQSVAIKIKATAESLTVTDNGMGISQKHLPFIFDKFYRVPTGDRHDVSGYGLGLYYVSRITRLFGWKIHAESTPGHGTTFTIKFSDR